MWNTVTIQYNPLIEEEWDEHFKVTCEYGYDFWKTVTFPFLDVEWVWLFQKVARNAPKKIGLIKSLLHLIGSQIFQAFTDTFLIVHMTFIFFAWWKIWHSSRWIKPILHPAKSNFSQWQPCTQFFHFIGQIFCQFLTFADPKSKKMARTDFAHCFSGGLWMSVKKRDTFLRRKNVTFPRTPSFVFTVPRDTNDVLHLLLNL